MEELIEKKLQALQDRNKRVEADKAWETSICRKVLIFVLTYVVASLWLIQIQNQKPFLNALVPAFGWYFSTLTIRPIKKWWINKNFK